MAIYHLSMSAISRSAGRTSTGAAAYRSASLIVDQRTGEEHDYTRKRGVVSSTIYAPADAPVWAHDREALWNAVEAKNKRKDALVAREIVVALPDELSWQRRGKLVDEFARELADRYHVAVDACIHKPSKKGSNKNHHAHLLISANRLGPDGFGNKVRELDPIARDRDLAKREEPGEIDRIRARWAEVANAHLAAAGSDARIDHRTLAEQGIDRAPGVHLGPGAVGFERRTGRKSRRRDEVEERQEAEALAAEIAQVRAELAQAWAEVAELETLERQIEQREKEAAEQRQRAEEERKAARKAWREDLIRRATELESRRPYEPGPAMDAWECEMRAMEAEGQAYKQGLPRPLPPDQVNQVELPDVVPAQIEPAPPPAVEEQEEGPTFTPRGPGMG